MPKFYPLTFECFLKVVMKKANFTENCYQGKVFAIIAKKSWNQEEFKNIFEYLMLLSCSIYFRRANWKK